MAPTPRKYLFDLSFDQTDDPVPLRLAAASGESRFTRAELEAARAAGIEEGRRMALDEAMATTEQRLADASAALAASMASLIERESEIRRKVEQEAVELLRALLRKLAPALAGKEPLAEIEAVLVECLAEALDEPRVALRVPDAIFEPMRERLSAIAQQSGFAGKFVLLADATLGPADCRLEWADGGAERCSSRLQQEIDALLQRVLTDPPIPSTGSNQETIHD